MSKAQQHPTGLSALATSALVMLAKRLGVDLSVEEAVTIVGLVTALVSIFTPRQPAAA